MEKNSNIYEKLVSLVLNLGIRNIGNGHLHILVNYLSYILVLFTG